MKNCEILVKQALMGAEQRGAEVCFLRTIDLRIGHCSACGACSAGLRSGKQVCCVIKDDYSLVEEAILDADAIILAAPVYVLAPTGQLKNFIDRFGPAHDWVSLTVEAKKRELSGGEPLDPRHLKRRTIGYISVGGAHTQNWASLGLAGLHLFGISNGMMPVGQIDAYDMGQTGSPFLDQPLMNKAHALGAAVADAAFTGSQNPAWVSEPGTCPVCHLNLITLNGTTTVECPICGISGKLVVNGDTVHVEFSPWQQARSRYTFAGLEEHFMEIRGMPMVARAKLADNQTVIEQGLRRFESYPPER